VLDNRNVISDKVTARLSELNCRSDIVVAVTTSSTVKHCIFQSLIFQFTKEMKRHIAFHIHLLYITYNKKYFGDAHNLINKY